MSALRRYVAALACVTAVVTVSACHSTKTTSGEGSPIGSVSVTPSDSTPATDTVTPTDATPTPTDTATTSASSSAAKPPPHSNNTCAFTQLGIRALRGSGAQQREYAAINFTNKGSKACTMYGYPGVSLRSNGVLLGQPATRDLSITPAIVKLNPGDLVQAQIVDNSSCQAALSDTVRVYPPDSTQYVDLPLELRGCTLTIQPVALN